MAKKVKIGRSFDWNPRPIVLFAGDYQFSNAARTILAAIPTVIRQMKAQFVYACRMKQAESRKIESDIRQQAEQTGLKEHIHFSMNWRISVS